MLKSRKRYKGGSELLLVAVFICLGSCDILSSFRPEVRQAAKQAQQRQSNLSAEPDRVLSPGEKLGFHRWLVTEMIEQTLGRPAKDRAEVDGWANVLSQRGSVEGVYHGIVLSTEYTQLEKGQADVKAIRFFAHEMAMLDSPASNEQDPKIKASSETYAKQSMSTPLFTMKRELGERLIRESEMRKDNRETLAAWYGALAARWARQNVDFGLSQRNQPDEVFHFNWARENNLGMIQWELLNKVHRLMNAYGGLKTNRAGK